MFTPVRRPPAAMPPIEPSTDFPTAEDEAPCPHRSRALLLAIGLATGLVLGLLAGLWLGTGIVCAAG